jgi:hypothetical protein
VSGATENLSKAEGATPKTALVFVIFLIAGPPVAILLMSAMMISLGYILGDLSPRDLPLHLRSLGVFVVASCMMGGVQALFVAGVAAVVQSMSPMGLLPLRPVLVACLLASLPFPAFVIITDRTLPPWDMLLALVGLHVGSGLLCWLICTTVLWPFRRRFGNDVAA